MCGSFSELDVSWILDSKKPRSPRMFFLDEESKNVRNSSLRLTRGQSECRTERVYITVRIERISPARKLFY